MEGVIPKEFGQDAIELPGSRDMLDKLEQQNVPWCIVTSGTRPLVSRAGCTGYMIDIH